MPSPKDAVPSGKVVYVLARLLATQPADTANLPPPWGVLCRDLDDIGSRDQRLRFLSKRLGDWGYTDDQEDSIMAAIAEVPILDGVVDGKRRFNYIPLKDLMAKKFDPIKWAVPGLLPEGLTLFAGRPKLGKSLFMLQVGLAIGSGGKVVGSIDVAKGDVLYLDMENGEELLQERGGEALSGEDAPEGFTFVIDSPNLQDGCMDMIETWVEDNPSARLIVIDTFEAVRARTEGKGNAYREDYAALRPLADLAKRLKVSIVVVHHTAKRASTNDVFDSISGSFGLNGAVDNLMILGDVAGQIVVAAKGRRVKYTEIPLAFDPLVGQWETSDGIAEQRRSETSKAIILAVSSNKGLTPREIIEKTGLVAGVVRQRLFHMCRQEVVVNTSGKYTLHHKFKVPRAFLNEPLTKPGEMALAFPDINGTDSLEDQEEAEMDLAAMLMGQAEAPEGDQGADEEESTPVNDIEVEFGW